MIRNHLRSNIVGYVAVFLALSGTAMATHPGGADTISTEDIINGQVLTNDISNSNGVRSIDVRDDTLEGGGLAAVDLASDSVGNAELVGGAVGTNEIGANQVLSRNIASAEVNSGDIGDDAVRVRELAANAAGSAEIAGAAVGLSEIAADGVGSSELAAQSVGTSELDFDSVDKSSLASNAVGADSIVELHEHTEGSESVVDGTAHDGAYAVATDTVGCPATEKLVSWSLNWTDDNGHNETVVANVPTIDRTGDDRVTITGGFDGGGGADDPARFEAVATCLGP